MTRNELIEAGNAELEARLGQRLYPDEMATILNAVEPLIRADERERHTVNNPMLLADLRAKVVRLNGTGEFISAYGVGYDKAIHDVLALIDGTDR